VLKKKAGQDLDVPKSIPSVELPGIEPAALTELLASDPRQGFLKPRVNPKSPAATKGTGESVAISALLEPTSGLLASPVTKSAPSLARPTVAHRCNSPCSPRAQAAQAPEPRTTSRIPMVRMSKVSVPDPGEKIRLGARIITAPTATRAAATSAKIEVDPWPRSILEVKAPPRLAQEAVFRCRRRSERLWRQWDHPPRGR
jgi:hypothetical protein